MNDFKPIEQLIEEPISGEWGSEGDTIKVVRTTNFCNDGRIDFSNVVSREIEGEKIKRKILKVGDIIIEKSGGSPTQPVGRVVYFENSNEDFLCNNFTSVLRPKKKIIFPKYLFYLLWANHQFGFTGAFQNKTTGIINLKLKDYIKKTKIPLPPLETQKKIAAILDAADAYRQKTKALMEKYDELIQSVFLEMFGDPVRNEKGWEEKALKNLGRVVTGSTPPSQNDGMFGGEIPFVTPGDLDSTQKAKRTLTENGAKLSRTVKKGSLLVCCIGATIGKMNLAKTSCAFNQQINAVEWFNEVDSYYGFFAFKFFKHLIVAKGISTTLPILKKSEFEKILIPVPPKKLQNEFAELIKKIEKQGSFARETLEKSEELFNSLLQKAFNGTLLK